MASLSITDPFKALQHITQRERGTWGEGGGEGVVGGGGQKGTERSKRELREGGTKEKGEWVCVYVYVCVCVCVCTRARTCMCTCVRACV